MGALIVSVLGGIIAVMATRNQGNKDSTSTTPNTAPRQNISTQARQGFRQGNAQSVSAKKTEGASAIVSPQSSKLINDTLADLNDRIQTSADPEWNMRFLNAKHRIVTQKNVNEGNPPPPGSSVVIPRVNEFVGNDSGPASGWTRKHITWQARFQNAAAPPSNAAPVNPRRKLDQNDDGDQTALVTVTTGPQGAKSVIYPSDWSGMRVVSEEELQAHKKGRGRSYNYARTPQAAPRQKIPNHAQIARNQWGSVQEGNG